MGISLILIIIFYYLQTKQKEKSNNFLHLSISINDNLKKEDTENLINIIKDQVNFLEISSLNQSKNNFNLNIYFSLIEEISLSSFNEKILNKFPDANIILSKDHNISL